MSNKSITVVGAGLQGQPIAYALSKLNFDIDLIDIDKNSLENAYKKISKMGGRIRSTACYANDLPDFVDRSALVISAAPFKANIRIAGHCAQRGLRYCDLGGNPEVSEIIQKQAKSPVCTDLGLAPGWVNLIAEMGCAAVKNLDGLTIRMRVGGLPVYPKGSLKYGSTFSVEGLVNEYQGQCDILSAGTIRQVDALGDLESIYIGEIDEAFEAFNTRGGITPLTLIDLQTRGVHNCDYKTLRYVGHCDLLRFLALECVVDLETALANACPAITEDRVIISVVFIDQKQNRVWSKVVQINYDDNWTAMQKATAFPAACVAAQITRGDLDHLKVVRYRDINLQTFQEDMHFLDPEISAGITS